jgi:hypothetical protein
MAKKHQIKKESIPEWLYSFLTEGIKPDNSNMRNFNQKPGTWECYVWSKNKTGSCYPSLSEVWKDYKDEVLKRWKGGKTFAEKKLLKKYKML